MRQRLHIAIVGAGTAGLAAALLLHRQGHRIHLIERFEAALEAYCAARRWHVRLFQALSAAFTPFYQSDSTLLPLVRDLVVAPISKTPPAPRLLAAMVSGTLLDPLTALDLPRPDWPALRTRAS